MLLPATNAPSHCWNFSSIPGDDQKAVIVSVEIEKLHPLQEAICNHNETHVSPFDPTKLANHYILRPEDDLLSNCGQNFKKTVSVDDIVLFIDEENIVNYVHFGCGVTFYPETPSKIRQINRERIYISRSCDKRKCIPSNDQHNCFFDKQHSSAIFLNRTIYGTLFQQLSCHSNTLMTDTLSPISTINQQFNNLEQFHFRCSFHCERLTVKEKVCASPLHSFRESPYRMDEWTKQLPPLKSWVISGNAEQWMESRYLWWTVIVFNCSSLFQLFVFCSLLVQYFLLFRNFTFLFSFFDDFEWEVKVFW